MFSCNKSYHVIIQKRRYKFMIREIKSFVFKAYNWATHHCTRSIKILPQNIRILPVEFSRTSRNRNFYVSRGRRDANSTGFTCESFISCRQRKRERERERKSHKFAFSTRDSFVLGPL